MRKESPSYQELEKRIEELELSLKLRNHTNDKKYKSIFNNAPIGIIVYDNNGNAIEVNERVLEILGSPSIELTKKINVLTFPPLIKVGFSDSFLKCLSSKKVVLFESRYISKFNKNIFLECVLSPIIDENGDVISIQCVFDDITKQKNYELKLEKQNKNYASLNEECRISNDELKIAKGKVEKSEATYKELSNLTFEGILIHDKGVVIDINLAFIKMFGYSREELLGKNVINVLFPNKYHKIILKNITKDYVNPHEVEGIKKDGSLFPIELEARNINKTNNNTYRVAAFRDITVRKKAEKELRKSEARFKSFFENNKAVMLQVDSATKQIINANNAAIVFYKYKKEELLKKTIYDLIVLAPESINILMKETLEKGSNLLVFKHKLATGEIKYVEVFASPINTGYQVDMFIIVTDITKRKEAELDIIKQNEEYALLNRQYRVQNKELVLAKEKSEESNKLKSEFLNNMSHEVRTPLNAIMGFSSILESQSLTDGKQTQYLKIIQDSGNQLMQIIDDIIEISKLETKQVKLIERELCINYLLLEQYKTFDKKIKESNVKLYLKNELSDKESLVITDKTILNRIISNLLENAVKYTNNGYIEFGYSLKKKHKPIELEFYVKDTGVGIELEKYKSIFERFSQEEKELSRNRGGLGLGLSIAKENAELLGGSITLKSKKGEGSTFFVTIPYKPSSLNTEMV